MCASLLLESILGSVEKKCQSLFSVWNEIGVESSELEQEVGSVVKRLDMLLDSIIIDKETWKTQLSQSVNELIEFIKEISSEIYSKPFDPPITTTLLNTYNFLLSEKERLLKDADNFIQEFNLLKKSERDLCHRLCEAEMTLIYKVVPSQEQMRLLSKRVDHLNLVKAERCSKFLELRSQMLTGYAKLGKSLRLVSDSCCLVKEILAPEALETFKLSEENMFSMADIVDQLASDCARVDTECKIYRDRLNLLLQLLKPLGVSCCEIEDENSSSTLRVLRTEVDRLEALRTRHMDTLISTAHLHVCQCWDDCFVGDEHRQNFKSSVQNKDSENVLTILEKEIITWKDFKETNHEFLLDVVRWCDQFSSFQSLKKPELVKSKIDSRRRSRSVPPGSRKLILSKVVIPDDTYSKPSKCVLDDINLCDKSTLTKQSVAEVESFFEGFKGNDKGPHVSTFIH
uniref:Protein regulator of cytokinesis 1 n=1 Tax=Schistosoma mansoni TaxID=6183 RepID=A0A3Q0KCR9_SCHMA